MAELSDEDVGLLSDDQVGVGSSEPASSALSDAAVGLMSDDEVGLNGAPATQSGRSAEGPLASGLREAAHAVIPAVAGTIAAGAGGIAGGAVGTAVAPGPGTVAGGLAGGVAGFVGGSMAGEYAQDKALKALGFDDDEQRAANAAANPKSTFVGGLAPAVATMNPVAAGEKLSQRLVQRGVGGAMMGGFEAGNELVQGQELDPVKLAISTAVGVAAPSFNKMGQKLAGVGERMVPGRPNRPPNPDAATAHEAVGDPDVADPHASAFGEPPPPVGAAQAATTGNPQSAPARSARVYRKGSDPAEQARYKDALDDPEAMREFAADQGITEAEAREIAQANYEPVQGDMLSQGDIAPDVGAALKAAHPEPAPSPAPAPVQPPAPQMTGTARQNPDGSFSGGAGANSIVFPPTPKAADAVAKSIGRNRNKNGPTLPEPVVDAGFPKPGDPLAVGENEATPMPRNETAINASVSDAQLKAGNYPKERTHDFGKPQRIETYAGDERRNSNPEGPKWVNKADYDYGYFNKTIGKDKDHVDFARPPKGSPDRGDKQFVIDQKDAATGRFDEHKVFTDYKDEAAARRHYESGFSDNKGADRLGAIKEISRKDLVAILQKHTTKPWNKPYSMVEEAAPKAAAKPLAERAVVKDLIAKGKTTPEAIAALPAGQVEAAIEGKRTRKYGVGTGASAGYPVEGIVNSDGKPVTANTKAKAQARSDRHTAVKEWFDTSTKKPIDYETETTGAMLDRLKKGQEALNSYDAMKSDPLFGKGSWVPSHKPREWLWAREANNVLKKPTPANIAKFRDAERLLKGSDEAVDNYRGGNRAEADIARSKRGGDEAIANAEAKNVDLGRNTAEDEMIAAIDAKRGGRFDVPHEEAETMVKPTPVKTAADLKELPHRTVNSHDEAFGKIDTNAISKKALSEADAALVGRKAKSANVPSEDRKGGEVRKIKIDDADKARIMAEMNKAAKRNERAKGDTDALPAERDPDVVPKRFTDLFDKFANDQSGSLNIGQIRADVKRLMNTLTKTSDHESYIAAESKGAMDDYARSLGDTFQSLRGEYTNHKLRLQEEGNAFPKEVNNEQALRAIFEAREKDSAHIPPPPGKASHIDALNPVLKAAYDQHLKPRFDQNDAIAAMIRQDHPDMIGADVEHHIQRLRKGDTAQFNLLMSNDDPTSPMYNALMVHANAAKDRKFYALERTSDGKRVIIAPTEKGYDYHVKGKIYKVNDPKFEFEANQPYKAGTNDTIMRQATTGEIEKHVLDENKKPMEFYKNAGFSAGITNLQLGEMLRNLNALRDVRNDPEFKVNSTTNQAKAKKEGWEEPNLPNFKGTYVHPAIKAALDDYAGVPQNALRRFASAVTKTLFWMPTAHIDNVGAHWLSARGYENFTPQGMKRLMQTAPKAFKSVINQDAFQAEMRREGAGLIYGGVLTREPVKQLAKVFGMDIKANPSKWGPIADKLGVPLKSLTGAIYDNASKVMWSVNDVLLTQRVMELRDQGKSMRHAIIDAERDIPNYRLPIKIMGSRMLQQALADPLKVAFGRYHYGMFNSYANQFKDLLGNKATPGDRLAAAGRLMTTGLLLSVIYPMIWDKGAQLITGNPDAKAQRRGPAAIPDKLIDAVHGKTDLMSAARSSLTLPPLTTTALETLSNRDFRGKPIVEPGDLAGTATQKGRAAVQFGTHIAKGLISPLSTISTNAQKDVSPLGAVRDQAADIKNPSKGSVKYEKLIGMHNQRDTIQRFKKGGVDPIEGLYNKLFGYK